jgi:peroxiredoxin
VPEDDGAADHLRGAQIPGLTLPAALGGDVDLAAAARRILVLYVYPRTGIPGQPLRPGWNEVPGARGCTVQNIAFRDRHPDLLAIGAEVAGLSAQPLAEVREFAERERIPYPLLADSELQIADAIGLPTFEFEGTRLYKRLTLVAREGHVTDVIYPVFPPGSDADRVVELLGGS